jgi:aminoglycoside phosphotransferase (APT) family kinase protein
MGAFTSIGEFHKALIAYQNLDTISEKDFPNLHALVSFYQPSWPQPVSTHGDLSTSNTLCKDGNVVGIVD